MYKVWNKNEDKQLKALYLKQNTNEVAKVIGRSVSACKNRAFYLGLTKLRAKRKYSVQMDFFKQPNLLNSYWAGFIAADGCIRDKLHHITLRLCLSDIAHMERFRKDVGYNGPIKTGQKTLEGYDKIYHNCNIALCGVREMIEDLKVNYSVISKKTKVLVGPKLTSKNHILAYICGYIDGDGNIGLSKNNRLELGITSGSIEILNWIHHQLDILVPTKKSAPSPSQHTKRKGTFRYRVTGYKAYKILRTLDKIRVPKLRRKWDKVSEHVLNKGYGKYLKDYEINDTILEKKRKKT